MDVIPAIDLLDGKCVRLVQGDYGKVKVFHDDPLKVALYWQRLGAPRLHVVDLDAAKTGEPRNYDLIAKIVASLEIPVQVGVACDRAKQWLISFSKASIVPFWVPWLLRIQS